MSFSWWTLLSPFWAMPNNILGVFGLDLTLSFWGSLFSGNFGRWLSWPIPYTGDRQGTFAFRRDGVLTDPERAWTYQHILWATENEIESLAAGRVIDPRGEYRPSLYGTILRGSPKSGPAMLLRGSPGAVGGNLLNWTRAGGVGEPAFPGSDTPRFPCGGFHLDAAVPKLRSEQDCPLAELQPAGPVATGSLTDRFRTVLPRTGLGLASNTLVALTDSQKQTAILNADVVEEVDGTTQIWLSLDPAGLARDKLRLRSLVQPPAPNTEDLPQAAGQATHLNLAASATPAGARPDYDRTDVLRFTDPANAAIVLGAGLVKAFETSLTFDADLPGDLDRPVELRLATPGAVAQALLTADEKVLDFTGTAAPGENEALLVTLGANSIAVVVAKVPDDPADLTRTMDRSLAPLGGAAGNQVGFAVLAGAADPLNVSAGRWDVGPANTVTYEAQNERSAPAVNSQVVMEDKDGRPVARTVTAVIFDALACERDIPAPNVRVERYTPGTVDESNASIQPFLTAALNTATDLSGQALQLIALNAPPPLAASPTIALQFAALTGNVATNITVPAGAALTNPVPAQLVVLNQAGAAPEAAVVRRVQLSFNLDRDLGLAGATNLELARLNAVGPVYNAQIVDATTITLLPQFGAAATQFARIRAGQLVQLNGGPAGPVYRVAEVERHGTTLKLAGGLPLVPPTPAVFTVQLLDVVDPANGTSRLGLNGTASLVGAVTGIVIDVWAPNAVAAGQTVGIIAGDVVHPALVLGPTTVQAIEFASAPALVPSAASPVTITLPTLTATGFSGAFRQESNQRVVIIDDDPPPLGATPNLVVLVSYRELTTAPKAWLSAGTTYVPEDPESWEFERKQSLVDHELRHTEQCLMWGPLLLTWFPLLAFQIPVELTTDVELPKFSAYVEGVVQEDARGRFLRIADTHGIDFKAGNLVQVAQTITDRPVSLTLGEVTAETTFKLPATPPAPRGAVFVKMDGAAPQVAGTVRETAGELVLLIPDFEEQAFAPGVQVEVALAGPATSLKLGAQNDEEEDAVFALSAGQEVPNGQVRVRRMKSGAGQKWDKFFDIMQFFTAGGVMNTIGGLVWGGVPYLAAKGGYFLGRHLFTKDPSHAATVSNDRLTLELGGSALPDNLRDIRRLTIRSGEAALVRTVKRATGTTLTLSSAIDFTGQVRVAPYSTRNEASKWDWHDYFPARVPDATQPAAIRIQSVGTSTHSLKRFDRVRCVAGERSLTTRVTNVGTGGNVELEDAPPTSGDERTLRIAQLNTEAPVGEVGDVDLGVAGLDPALTWFLNPLRTTGMDWMRWLFDPWGQLNYRVAPDASTFWGKTARIARYAFGMRSWSLAFPGWYLWDNLFKQIDDDGHLSQMEQDASEESGDLYSPLSRVRPGTGALRVVGDFARFWYWPWGSRLTLSVLTGSRQDRAGIPYAPVHMPRLLPSFANTAAAADPNGTAEAPAGSGNQLPDWLVQKNLAAFDNPAAANPASFQPAQRAWIPTSPKVERALGAYVAFTRPGKHRLSVQNGINMALEAREAQEGGSSFLFSTGQSIRYDVDVADVEVEIAGQSLAEGGTVVLVQTQRAAVNIKPNTARRYVASLLRPDTGDVRLAEDDEKAIVAQTRNVDEPLELCRFYEFTPDATAAPCSRGGDYNAAVLNAHGLNIRHNLYVPVRGGRVQVVDTVPVRSARPTREELRADVNVHTILAGQTVQPGVTVFVLVPAALQNALRLTAVDYPGGRPAVVTDPAPDPDDDATVPDGEANTPKDLSAFVGDGNSYTITFSRDDPPEAPVNLTFQTDVGAGNNSATLSAVVQLVPHFVLAGNTDVARGTSLVLKCPADVADGEATVTPSTDVTVGVTADPSGAVVTIDVAAGAAVGTRRVVVATKNEDPIRKARRTIQVI